MAWIRIIERWVWRPNSGTAIVYKPGDYNVPRATAKLAVESGKAMRLRKTRRDADPVVLPGNSPVVG